MFRNRFLRRILHKNLFEIDQVKLVYFLSLVVGLLSALAAALLKYSIHYIHKILTEGITLESGSYLYLAYPLIGMLLTFLFVKYIVKDNIGHGISRILFSISRKKSHLKNT
jgi:CIC family chloride channel protein